MATKRLGLQQLQGTNSPFPSPALNKTNLNNHRANAKSSHYQSQGFVKPADLFKMRRKKSVASDSPVLEPAKATPVASSSVPSSPSKTLLASHQTGTHLMNPPNQNGLIGSAATNMTAQFRQIQQQSPMKSPMKSPRKDASGIRHLLGAATSSNSATTPSLLIQSPLKCLSNTIPPSPVKKLPTLLRNPFGSNQNSNSSSSSLLFKSPMKTPIKRKLNLDENRSPRKKHRMIELDEDANLEPPKATSDESDSVLNECEPNDWSLRTKMRINFKPRCKNFLLDKPSTHKRSRSSIENGNLSKKSKMQSDVDPIDKDINDSTISIEAIKNVCTVYQHPYMAWMPLFPRITIDFKSSKEVPLNLAKQPQIANSLHKDWCDSLNDLVSLLNEGLCPYFYMCTDLYNILFRYVEINPTDTDQKDNHIQAYISPCSYGLRSELKRQGVDFVCSTDSNETSSQNVTINPLLKELESTEDTEAIHDSGLASSDDSNESPDDKDETSQFLESLGLSQHDFPSLTAPVKRKSMDESSKNTISSVKSMTTVIGYSNVMKMIEFLKSSRLYTMTNVGKFACIPPTLLSPVQFRRSTPQQPEVVLSKQVDETVKKPSNVKSKLFHQKEPESIDHRPSFVELKGIILPGTYDEIHALLNASNNTRHSCSATILDSTTSYKQL